MMEKMKMAILHSHNPQTTLFKDDWEGKKKESSEKERGRKGFLAKYKGRSI